MRILHALIQFFVICFALGVLVFSIFLAGSDSVKREHASSARSALEAHASHCMDTMVIRRDPESGYCFAFCYSEMTFVPCPQDQSFK